MNKSKAIIPLLVSLALLSLAPLAVRADKPYRKYAYNGVTPVTGGKWIECYHITSWETETPGIYRVSISFTFSFVGESWTGEDEMWVWRFHYRGTSKSWYSASSSNLLTGKMEYTLQDTFMRQPHAADEWDGNYRIWFEDGEIVKTQGRGYLYLP
jgi:hypothetical protein